MCAKIALGQLDASDSPSDNLQKIRKFAAEAGEQGADILVLPEYSMGYPKKGGAFPAGQSLDGPFCQGLRAAAREHGLYISCGMLEKTGTEKMYNTTVLFDRQGELLRAHRKNHLYGSASYRESEYFQQGDSLFEPIDTDFGRLGLLVCYEIRFPELTRIQAMEGVDILLVGSAFVSGPHKALQWHALLRARAIENAFFVCASNHTKPHVFLGESCAYDPNGETLGELGQEEGLLLVSCDVHDVARARQTNTAILQRRPELYGFACEQ